MSPTHYFGTRWLIESEVHDPSRSQTRYRWSRPAIIEPDQVPIVAKDFPITDTHTNEFWFSIAGDRAASRHQSIEVLHSIAGRRLLLELDPHFAQAWPYCPWGARDAL